MEVYILKFLMCPAQSCLAHTTRLILSVSELLLFWNILTRDHLGPMSNDAVYSCSRDASFHRNLSYCSMHTRLVFLTENKVSIAWMLSFQRALSTTAMQFLADPVASICLSNRSNADWGVIATIFPSTVCPSVLWHCWLGHLTRKNRPWYDL